MKKFFAIITVIIMLFSLCITSFAISPNDTINPKGIYLRELVEYDYEPFIYDYTYKLVGQVSGDNTYGNSPLTITASYSYSDTISASFGITTLMTAEIDFVIAKVSAGAEFAVTAERSWTKGEIYGGTYSVPAGKKQKLSAYIPRVSTKGSLKYKVHMDGYSNYWYEYSTLPTTYLPAKSCVHFVVSDI